MPATPLLHIEGLCKRYAAPVLRDVALQVERGQVHALVGANGAGKSTLAKIVCGLTPRDSGTLLFDGRPYDPHSKTEAAQAGIHLVMQELNLIPTLSIAENLFLGRLPRRFGLIDYPALHRQAQQVLADVGLETLDPRLPVSTLGVGHQQLIEIARALSQPCRLLILDEPTAALTDPQIEQLFAHIHRLRSEGVGIIYISHRMEELARISDHMTVLRDGQVVASQLTASLTLDTIIRHMAGQEATQQPTRKDTRRGEVALRVAHLRRGKQVQDVSFEVRQGEVLGLAGLIGAGRTETLRAIFGADPPEGGAIYVGGQTEPAQIRQPRDAVRAGIGMIPEDRKQQGLLLPHALRLNTTLAAMKQVSRAGWIDPSKEEEAAHRYIQLLDIQVRSPEQPMQELSGGNQQKVVVARWLFRDCPVLLFDEPTRGIDVTARHRLYELFDTLTAAGKALVVVSSDLRELMAICDRIAVLSAGRLVDTFDPDTWTHDALMAAAISGYLASSSQAPTA